MGVDDCTMDVTWGDATSHGTNERAVVSRTADPRRAGGLCRDTTGGSASD